MTGRDMAKSYTCMIIVDCGFSLSIVHKCQSAADSMPEPGSEQMGVLVSQLEPGGLKCTMRIWASRERPNDAQSDGRLQDLAREIVA